MNYYLLAVIWVIGGLIASRISLFRLQDENGEMRTYTQTDGYGERITFTYCKTGWPLLWGVLWPVCTVAWALVTLAMLPVPLFRWWYTKPAVRKARRYNKVVTE